MLSEAPAHKRWKNHHSREQTHTEEVFLFGLNTHLVIPIWDFCLKDVEVLQWVRIGTSCSKGFSGRVLAACKVAVTLPCSPKRVTWGTQSSSHGPAAGLGHGGHHAVHTVHCRLAIERECPRVRTINCQNSCIASHSQLAFTAAKSF